MVRSIIGLVLIVASITLAQGQPASGSRPNVAFIRMDDLRWHAVYSPLPNDARTNA